MYSDMKVLLEYQHSQEDILWKNVAHPRTQEELEGKGMKLINILRNKLGQKQNYKQKLRCCTPLYKKFPIYLK